MQHYQLHQEKIIYFIISIGTIFLLTINMCDRESHDFTPRYDLNLVKYLSVNCSSTLLQIRIVLAFMPNTFLLFITGENYENPI